MKLKTFLVGSSVLMFGVCIGLVVSLKMSAVTTAQSQSVKTAAIAAGSVNGFDMEDAVINVAETTGKAVVSITAEHITKVGGRQFTYRGPSGEQEELFRRFFDEFFGEMPEREYRQVGVGSGVIIDSQGFILTNQHVVAGADKLSVTLPDGRQFTAELKGQDARSDLAVIKINARNLPVAQLGDSDTLRIGQWVIAIGNPFGISVQNAEPTVTTGVVSALHRTLGRTLGRGRDYNDLIQTDAAINPGNSGGPLVNLKGEIIGINVAIFSTSGGYQGVGFAIPANSAKRIVGALLAGKKVQYGWLGVTIQELNDDMAGYFGLKDKLGVLVANVVKDGPAARSGIKASDVIVSFDGKPTADVKALLSIVGQAEVGRKVKVQLIRDKKPMTLEVEVGQRPDDVEGENIEQAPAAPAPNWRGIKAEDLSAQTMQRFEIQEKTAGVIVTEVETRSPADEAGILPGDIIVEVNRQPVGSMDDYRKITKGARGDVLVRTERGFFLVKESSQ